MEFALACQGKTKSQGGLNKPEFQAVLRSMYPHRAADINSLSRDQFLKD